MKFLRFTLALMAAFSFVACGDESDEPGTEPGTTPTAGYTIAVDRETIDANGVDAVTFSVFDAEGNDLTLDKDVADKIYFVDAATEERLQRKTKIFTALRDAEYTFYATVRGEKTANTVTIKAQNRAKYEKYRQMVCVYKCTATWCAACPYMTLGLKNTLEGKWGDHLLVMAVHGDDEYTLPINLGNGYGLLEYLLSTYGGTGTPYAVIDLSYGTGQRTMAMMNTYIEGQLKNYPATCGVKIASTAIDKDGNITIEAAVTASKAGVFDLGFAILMDNMPGSGSSTESVYNNVVAGISPNFLRMSNETKVTLAEGQEYTTTFTIGSQGLKAEDMSVLVFAHSEVGGGMIDNAAKCKMGESIDYVLN